MSKYLRNQSDNNAIDAINEIADIKVFYNIIAGKIAGYDTLIRG